LCLDCHGPHSPNGPHTATLEEHTHRKSGSAGSEGIACHMPKIEQTIADVNVRSHTFRFITPAATDKVKVPNPCSSCHVDRPARWVKKTRRRGQHFSAGVMNNKGGRPPLGTPRELRVSSAG